MADLKTTYCGLTLKNPIVMGASNIVTDPGNLQKLEQAGVGAIVYKSLFEEQIEFESMAFDERNEAYSNWDAEHDTLFPVIKHAGPAEHLLQLREARRAIGIPLIGSLNCVSYEAWIEYAVKMKETGIDALELNFYYHNIDFLIEGKEIEAWQIDMLKKIRKAVHIPIAVKLSPFYSNTLSVITQMDKIGVDGFVLFNRLFQPDIDVDRVEHHYPYNFSSENDNRLSLRYAGLLYGNIKSSVIANTGVFTGKDAIKMILAGADAVQVVSAVYKKGIHHITHILEEIDAWMNKHNYLTISDFRGKLSRKNHHDPFAYKRAQYVDILMKSDIYMQYHPKDGDGETQHDNKQ